MTFYELTIPQRNIWNLHQYYEGTAIANQCGVVCFRTPEKTGQLQAALREVLRKQDGLRLRITKEASGSVVQYVSEEIESVFPVISFDDDKGLNAYAKETVVSINMTIMFLPLIRVIHAAFFLHLEPAETGRL